MSNLKLNKKKGIVFWITGLSGSGKTKIGQKIKNDIIKRYGPTILFSGDDIRNIFSFKKSNPWLIPTPHQQQPFFFAHKTL